jgi:hypothetical protein
MAIGCILNIGGSADSTPTYYDLIDTVTSDWSASNFDQFVVTQGTKIRLTHTKFNSSTPNANAYYNNSLKIKSDIATLNFSATSINHQSSTIKIYVSDNNGSTWTQVASNTGTGNPAFNVNLASYKGKYIKVRIEYYAQINYTDGLDVTVFNIQA